MRRALRTRSHKKVVVLRHTSFIVSLGFLRTDAHFRRKLRARGATGLQKALILRSWKP